MTDAGRISSLVEANSEALFAYLVRRVAHPEDAADLLSEVFLATWRRRRELPDDDERARMWMFGTARRVLANYYRGRRRRMALADGLRAELRGWELSAPRNDVRDAIAALPDQFAEIVRLIHWDGFNQAEIAQLLGIPASTVRGRYARARALLSESLSERDLRASAAPTGR